MSSAPISSSMPDWSYAFVQKDGSLVDPENPFLEGVNSITALHKDEVPLNSACMVLLNGRKRFWFLPDTALLEERECDNPCFVSSLAVE